MTSPSQFPKDPNGDALRQMAENGDDLSAAREVEFAVVMPNEEMARGFGRHFKEAGYGVQIEQTNSIAALPWDVIVAKHMVPTHSAITEFERELARIAAHFGGRNDGWGCFAQNGPPH